MRRWEMATHLSEETMTIELGLEGEYEKLGLEEIWRKLIAGGRRREGGAEAAPHWNLG